MPMPLISCPPVLVERRQTERIKHARGNRTSKGAEKWLDVQEHRGTAACVAHLRARGFRVLVTAPRPGSVPVQDVDFTRPTAFLLGNEVDGARSRAHAAGPTPCDHSR